MILVKEAHENYLNAFTFFQCFKAPSTGEALARGVSAICTRCACFCIRFLSETAFGSVWQWGLTALGLCKKQIFLIENFNLADSLCVFL